MGDSSRNLHSVIGSLAKTLRRCNIPKPSIVIDDKFLSLATSHSVVPAGIPSLQDVNSNHERPLLDVYSNKRPVISISPVIPDCTSGYHDTQTELQQIDLQQIELQQSELQQIELQQTELAPNPGSLLSLLVDESDVPWLESNSPTEDGILNPNVQLNNNGPCPATASGSTNTNTNLYQTCANHNVPDYLKVPAHIFPVVIGDETYLLPYEDDVFSITVALRVLSAHGDYVLVKVVGYTDSKPNTEFPDGVTLGPQDAVQLLPVAKIPIAEKSARKITDVKQEFAVAAEPANQDIPVSPTPTPISSMPSQVNNTPADHVTETPSDQQIRTGEQANNRSANGGPSTTKRAIHSAPSHQIFGTEYIDIASALFGTVLQAPVGDVHGLITYEIKDGAATTFLRAHHCTCPMVGGETVQFDLALNCDMRKCEAVRVKLAPINVNLKNGGLKRKNGKIVNRSKSSYSTTFNVGNETVAAPQTIFTPTKLVKVGMIGRLTRQPTSNKPGAITYLVGTATPHKALIWHVPRGCVMHSNVNFDLSVWFRIKQPMEEATNVQNATKVEALPVYNARDFLLETLGRNHWIVGTFKALLVALVDARANGDPYNWTDISVKVGHSRTDVKNTLKMLIKKINKRSDGPMSPKTSKKLLDNFVTMLTEVPTPEPIEIENTSPPKSRERQPQQLLIPVPKRTPGRTQKPSGGIAVMAVKKSARHPAKKAKKRNTIVTKLTASGTTKVTQPAYPELTPHQSFVARNLMRWCQVPEVPGDRQVNSVLSDVMITCAATHCEVATLSGAATHGDSTTPRNVKVNYPRIYMYIGALLGENNSSTQLPELSSLDATVLLHLIQSLIADIAKRNLHTHKQFLLQRFFDITSNKTITRTPINPFKLKGFLLHLPEPS